MEFLLFIAAIWVAWALFAHWRSGKERGRSSKAPGTQRDNQARRANTPDEKWQQKIARQASSLAGRREQVLSALREGRLNPAQIAQVLQAASLYHVDADVKLTHRADWILTRGYDALSVVVGV